MELYLATQTGLVVAEKQGGEWRATGQGLKDRHLTSIIAREGVILAGTTDGIYRSEDRGQTWQESSHGLTIRHVRWMAYHPRISDLELAGTEPAAIFLSHDGGATWQERPEVSDLRDEFGWWLPYSPEAGCVRGFAFAASGPRAYAAVEVGGVLRSDDNGETWQLAPGSDGRPSLGRRSENTVHPDVHSVAVHPSSPDRVFAPTGGGFYSSQDGGETWDPLYSNCYVRAVWLDPEDPSHMILGPARNSSGSNGRIEESHDGGQTWHPVTKPWSRNMVERFIQIDGDLFAVTANGTLFSTPLTSLDWQPILPHTANIHDVTSMKTD